MNVSENFATTGKQNSVIKELGEHNGNQLVIKDGRYGIYITDGKVNATLPKDLDYKSVDLKQAIELINNKKAKKK